MGKTEKEVEKLLDLLENASIVKEYKRAMERVYQEASLVSQLQKYQETKDPYLKKEILKQEVYSTYHEKASRLALLFWGIQMRFQKMKERENGCALSKENTKEEF